MRQRNHCSSSKGIPKMKLQASEPSGPESLQSQTRPCPKNRLSISRLGVVHGRLHTRHLTDGILRTSLLSSLEQKLLEQPAQFKRRALAAVRHHGRRDVARAIDLPLANRH